MAKISTYPSADNPLLLSDRLIGTEAIRPVPSPTPLATKNFSLADLLQLFSANFPAASLQAVLNTGNTATQNITLTGTITTTLIKPINIEDTSGSQGLTFQVLSKGTSSINWVNIPVDTLQAVLNAGNTATQNITLIGDITSTKIIPGNIQDELGFIGIAGQLLSKTATGIKWIVNPTTLTPGLGDVLSVSNTATNNITLIGNITATSIIKSGGTNLQYLMADGSVTTGGGGVTSVTGTSPIISSGGTTPAISIPLGTSLVDGYLSAIDRTNFQNAYTNRITSLTTIGSGAATLVSNVLNIPTTSLTGFVPYTGATQAVNLGAFNLTVNSISVGKGAGTGPSNTVIGASALSSNTTGGYNTAIGFEALRTNTIGAENVAVGYLALYSNTTSQTNVAVGNRALQNNVGGSGNVAVGHAALQLNTSGTFNLAVGPYCLSVNTIGNSNTAIGYNSLNGNTTGSNNVSLGLQASLANTIGASNTVIGVQALLNNIIGNNNTALGRDAARYSSAANLNTSTESVFLGFNTRALNTSSTNEIVIGANAIGSGDNTVTLGHTSITTTRLRGAVQGGSFVKDGGTSSEYLLADGSVTTSGPSGYKYNFSGSVTLTGTLITTNLLTIIIPANSLSDYLNLRSLMVQQSGPVLAGFQIRVWHNSVNNFNTATRIANFAFGGGGADLFAQMTRKFSIQSGLLFGFSSTPSNATGEGSNSNAALSIPFNTAIVNYLFVSIQLNNVTDTAILRNVNITN